MTAPVIRPEASQPVNAISPFQFVVDQQILPIAEAEGISREVLNRLLTMVNRLPRMRQEHVWRFEGQPDLEDYIRQVQQTAIETKQPMAVIGIDIKNLGGLNEAEGEPRVNELVIGPFLEMIIAALKELCGGVDGAWWQLFHFGGDEYVIVIFGIHETKKILVDGQLQDCHDVSRALDGLVRTAAQYCTSRGLDLIPHAKKWWRIGHWGTGLTYGIYSYDPEDKDQIRKSPTSMLEQAFRLMQRYKRGLGDDKHNPVDPTISIQLKRMFWLLTWAWTYKLFGFDWTKIGKLFRRSDSK